MFIWKTFAGRRSMVFVSCLAILALCTASALWAQSTVSTGSIQGTVTDPNGAVVSGANITITNKATGTSAKTNSTASGTYSSGALLPGQYDVRIENKGFRTEVLTVTVQVGVVTTGNAQLVVGQASEVIEVTGAAVAVNTEQSTVQGVLNAQQIENLPINGRNFLDLAQLEPGVQIQDGGNFDPTKNGFSSISFGGRFGRTARIEVDGIDISDETVGTTTQNLPASAIQEFQVSQSSLDLSTELTSSGAVNVVTKSGTNKWHGEGFYLFRDHAMGARVGPTDTYFQRNNFGGALGGPIVKDKLFFFVDVERLKQDFTDPVTTNSTQFTALNGGFSAPFRDTEGIAKLDWHINDNYQFFYRFSYEQNHSIRGFIQNSFQPFLNQNNTPVHVAGLNFSTGTFTHSIRFGFTKFRNGIGDASAGAFNPLPGISLNIGDDVICLTGGVDAFCSGPNLLAPQKTFQENTQAKYDGSKIIGKHILRLGAGFNHIQGGGFAKFFALAPTVNSGLGDFNPANAPFPGGASNPLNYPVMTVLMGNGQGFSSEKPAFGLPGGGLGPDNRIQLYIGDSWKIRTNLTLTYGLRYVHDTGRTDSDLGAIPCSQLDPGLEATLVAAGTPCTTNVLDLWGRGLGAPVRDPAMNFAPQFGFVWDPTKAGKMVIRGGIGLYYENSIYNNNLFNRPGRLAKGLFLQEAVPCAGGNALGLTLPTGPTIDTSAICGQPVGTVANQLIALQQQYQQATLTAGPAVNGAFIGNTLAAGGGVNGINMFAPNYQTPRSVQMNIGFEKQLGKGIVWNADYVRNVGTHTLLAIDVNHVGDARFFNKTNAINAINATLAACSVGSINQAIQDCPGLHPSTPQNPGPHPATIADFAGSGLDSGTNLAGGFPAPGAAFPGQNPNLGVNQMLFSGGRSVYNAFETSLRANVARPFKGVKAMNWQFSYAFSRNVGSALDQDFVNTAPDNNHPNSFMGPNGLDRTHQFSFGGYFDLPGGFRFGSVTHVYSPLPANLVFNGPGPGGIFQTDVTGDGSGDGSGVYVAGDLIPGTKLGAYGRSIKPGDLAAFITNYNNKFAGQATPAGQVLINNGLFTLAQLQALGGVMPTLAMPTAANGAGLGLGWLRTVDFRLSYPKRFGERFTVEPSVSVFNTFNWRNTDAPGNTLNGILGTNCSIAAGGCSGGIQGANDLASRVTPGSGVFDLAAPRVFEFGMKISF
jgi:Carboxypeptidase regulatory-like domain